MSERVGKHMLQVALTPSQERALKELAESKGTTQTAILRNVIGIDRRMDALEEFLDDVKTPRAEAYKIYLKMLR